MDTTYRRDASTVARRIGDETILVPVRRNVGDLESIFTLNAVAAVLWGRLERDQTVERLADAVSAEFEVTPEQAAADTSAFLREMVQLGLVEEVAHA